MNLYIILFVIILGILDLIFLAYCLLGLLLSEDVRLRMGCQERS